MLRLRLLLLLLMLLRLHRVLQQRCTVCLQLWLRLRRLLLHCARGAVRSSGCRDGDGSKRASERGQSSAIDPGEPPAERTRGVSSACSAFALPLPAPPVAHLASDGRPKCPKQRWSVSHGAQDLQSPSPLHPPLPPSPCASSCWWPQRSRCCSRHSPACKRKSRSRAHTHTTHSHSTVRPDHGFLCSPFLQSHRSRSRAMNLDQHEQHIPQAGGWPRHRPGQTPANAAPHSSLCATRSARILSLPLRPARSPQMDSNSSQSSATIRMERMLLVRLRGEQARGQSGWLLAACSPTTPLCLSLPCAVILCAGTMTVNVNVPLYGGPEQSDDLQLGTTPHLTVQLTVLACLRCSCSRKNSASPHLSSCSLLDVRSLTQ